MAPRSIDFLGQRLEVPVRPDAEALPGAELPQVPDTNAAAAVAGE